MSLDHYVALFSAGISFAGLLLVVLQLRQNNKERESASLVELYDINRQLISLGFSHPQLFAIMDDAKNADPIWERRYLQLWLNQFSLIHLYLRRSVFDAEIKDSLERDLADFMTMGNVRRHWQKHGAFFPVSFQELVNGILEKAGPLSTHFYHGLKALGFPVVCIDARHAHGTLKAQRIKTDKNDARGLAHIARTGWYKAVHVKSDEGLSLRTLVAGRKQIVNMRVCLESHIRGTLKTFGIKLGAVTHIGFSGKVREVIGKESTLVQSTLDALVVARDGLLAQEMAFDRQCQQLARQDTVCKRLMTVPGVGTQTALAFRSEIDDPSRFRHSRDVGVHLGLTPRKYASGEVDRSGSISKCGNQALRTLLFEAAVTMMTRSKKWSRLKAWGVQLAKRSSFKMAAAAVARKLAVIMHRMWIDGTNFAYGDAPMIAAA